MNEFTHEWRPMTEVDRSFRTWKCDGCVETCNQRATWICEEKLGPKVISVKSHRCNYHVPYGPVHKSGVCPDLR